MSPPSPSIEEFIPEVHQRIDFFEFLSNSPASQKELNRELDKSQSTIYRGLNSMEEYGLIEKRDDEYQLTPFGVLIFDEYRRFSETIKSLLQNREVFDTTQPINAVLHPSLFQGARILSTNDYIVEEIYEKLQSSISEASHLYGVAPTIFPNQIDLHLEKTTANELTAEFILPHSAIEYLQSNFNGKLDTLQSSDNFSIRVSQETPPVGLITVLEPSKKVVIVIHDEIGTIRGLVISENPESITWGKRTYQSFREDSISFESYATS
ncbi:helix-turn-helix transcriptional regulator [Haloarcula rubripromontorii]|nr:helix-turn-helix domain-containing protein [Haloarcula rubripromontorii]